MDFSQESPSIKASEDKNLKWLKKIGVTFEGNTVKFNSLSHKINESLEKWRKLSPECDIKNAIESLNPYFINPGLLSKWLILPENSPHTLVHILSRDAVFQKPIYELVCHFLSLTAFDTNNKFRHLVNQIIKSLSYPPQLYEADSIVHTVFDAINNSNEVLQPILIQSLYQIIIPTQDAVKRLVSIMVEKPKLTKDCLCALEGFQLTKEDTEMVRERVLNDILSSASTSDLPTVIRFLVSTTDESNAPVTVDTFRKSVIIYGNRQQENALTTVNDNTSQTPDTNKFLVIQLRSNLQFFGCFCNAFIAALESCTELYVLDFWVIYCLFSIPAQKLKAEQLITKLCETHMTADAIRDSIIGHVPALESILNYITDLISWCVGHANTRIADIGTTLALALFEEVENPVAQQNIVGSLLMQIGIGNDGNKLKAAAVLSSLDEEKLKLHLPLISGIIYSYASIPIAVFKIVVAVVVRLEFSNVAEQGSQLHIFVSKMLASTKPEAKQAGVITSAAILNRFAHFQNVESIKQQFQNSMIAIGDDPLALNQFFQELVENENRGDVFNDFLIETLTRQFILIFVERRHDLSDWYCLDEELESAIDFIGSIGETAQRKTLTIQKHRQTIFGRNGPITFSHSGLRLLLDAHVALKHDIEQIFGDYFKMPFAMFDRGGSDYTNYQKVQVILLAHSFILETINYFGYTKSDACIERMSQRIDLENLLVTYLQETKNFIHPFFGDIFPKYGTIIKKAINDADPGAYFVSHFRGSFNAPRIEYLDLLLGLDLPLNEETVKISLRLFDDYLYLLKIPENVINPKTKNVPFVMFSGKKLTNPPLSIIEYISKNILNSILDIGTDISQKLVIKILDILNTQIAMHVYKEKKIFANLLEAICGERTRQKAFHYFYEKFKEKTENEVKMGHILLLRALLHCGPPVRGALDVYGNEMKQLCGLCKDMLKEKTPRLYVKKVLPIFFDHNSSANVLEELKVIIFDVIDKDIFSSNDHKDNDGGELWKSLTRETFVIYFQQCFALLNSKLSEIAKNLKTNKVEVLDEQTILLMMERINVLASLAQVLLAKVSSPEIPSALHQKAMLCGQSWMDSCTALLDFLKDARQVDSTQVDTFISIIRTIRRNLQGIVNHVRRNETNLLPYIPKLSKSLSSWTYNLKSALTGVYEAGEMKIGRMPERTIDGEFIHTQRNEDNYDDNNV